MGVSLVRLFMTYVCIARNELLATLFLSGNLSFGLTILRRAFVLYRKYLIQLISRPTVSYLVLYWIPLS